MIFKVTVQGESFDVEIADIYTDPIIARIGEDIFEIKVETPESNSPLPNISQEAPRLNGLQTNVVDNVIPSPIPGVVNKILVEEGQTVAMGDPLLVIEAMKMNNTIRANRAGMIEKILVETGNFVKHHQSLISFAD